MYDIYCLMVGGVGLNDRIRNYLFAVARNMVLNGDREFRIVSDDLEGFVTTDMKTVTLGSIAGIVFSAEVESVRGSATVRFIVRTKDIATLDPEGGRWETVSLPSR